jgi:hypothetical protein
MGIRDKTTVVNGGATRNEVVVCGREGGERGCEEEKESEDEETCLILSVMIANINEHYLVINFKIKN